MTGEGLARMADETTGSLSLADLGGVEWILVELGRDRSAGIVVSQGVPQRRREQRRHPFRRGEPGLQAAGREADQCVQGGIVPLAVGTTLTPLPSVSITAPSRGLEQAASARRVSNIANLIRVSFSTGRFRP